MSHQPLSALSLAGYRPTPPSASSSARSLSPPPAFPTSLPLLSSVDYSLRLPVPLPSPLRVSSVMQRAQSDGRVQAAVEELERRIREGEGSETEKRNGDEERNSLESHLLARLFHAVSSLPDVVSAVRDAEASASLGKSGQPPASALVARMVQAAHRGVFAQQQAARTGSIQAEIRRCAQREYSNMQKESQLFAELSQLEGGFQQQQVQPSCSPSASPLVSSGVARMLSHSAESVLLTLQNEQIARSNAAHERRQERERRQKEKEKEREEAAAAAAAPPSASFPLLTARSSFASAPSPPLPSPTPSLLPPLSVVDMTTEEEPQAASLVDPRSPLLGRGSKEERTRGNSGRNEREKREEEEERGRKRGRQEGERGETGRDGGGGGGEEEGEEENASGKKQKS